MATLKQLQAAAKELNDLFGLKPAIDVTLSADEMVPFIQKAIEMVEPQDEFSTVTQKVIDELKALVDEEEVVEETVEAIPLETQVEDAETITELKSIVKNNDEFVSLRKGLGAKINLDDLREEMLDILDEAEAAKKPAAKPTGKPAAKPAAKVEEKVEEEVELDVMGYKDMIEDAATVAELKEIVKKHDLFHTLRSKLATKYTLDELSTLMLGCLDLPKVTRKPATPPAPAGKPGTRKPAPVEEEDDDVDVPAAKKPAAKTEKPVTKKKEGKPFSAYLDETIKEGGSWEEMRDSLLDTAEKMGVKVTTGMLKSHAKYRTSKDAKFLGKLKITEAGIK